MKKFTVALAAALFVGSLGLTLADEASPKERLENQHERIEQGVDSGTISKKEHRKLARQGRHINRERKRDLRKDGGKLDKQDRRKLEKEENHRSNEIYNDKHN